MSIAGLVRAVQFNAVTAIAYAELPPRRIGAGTALNTMAWQLAIMLGMALSSVTVTLATQVVGRTNTTPTDFGMAFLLLAAIGMLACRPFAVGRPGPGTSRPFRLARIITTFSLQ